MLKYDVLVIGSGGAGMQAALVAAKSGELNVALMTKVFPTRSATCCAQGGTNAALRNVDKSDSIEKHAFDTIKGSDFLADQDAVEFFVSLLPETILELDYFGVPFSRLEDGTIAQRPFGGQSHPRTCYSADKIGAVVLHTLYEQCLKNQVNILTEWFLLDLVVENEQIIGVVAMNMKTGDIHPILAKAVVLATGGAGRVYWNRTTNPFASTGDGMAAAFRVGVALKDPEFVQFHPTGLAGTGILMSEACRGEGGYLLNNKGERFMQRYAPEKMELATRDLVSQAIETEIKEGRGFGEGINAYVLLDLRHLGREKILERLPQIRELAIQFEGIDPIEQPIPVRPSCHYSMGGIDVIDYKTCATVVKGLYAAGECSCISIHGANRLGGNSTAEAVAFGKVAGKAAAEYAQNVGFSSEKKVSECAKKWENEYNIAVSRTNGPSVASIRSRLAETMWLNVGVFRKEKEMLQAAKDVDALIEEYKYCVVGDKNRIYNTAFTQYIELGNMLTVAKAIVIGALNRRESRGSHKREDYPQRDDKNYLKHTIITLEGSEYKLSYRPVVITKYQPAERRY
ncbi:FAD-binding protein [Carboxydothermus hydrogenoformans]|uniref:Fumarate reductase, flavoprotein subunit n=1 Tax=Carboxydothermus hydrogenoformans (strain ATCC BAA-161 / DSM 6008 / Z-2901) TaxID=246194 RepID=Q3AFZ9_CARHZ|nr:FAD-binding protein [Carboxydothermus hydrogenoformans]ABB15737.1 fumarate reductase, flavoprotein subunit [Carboxydothermus hydrogenoformans Z-2901]